MPDFNFSELINSLNPQIAAGPPKVDFSALGDLPQSYYSGRESADKLALRNAFKPTAQNPDGVPMKDGQVDLPAVMKTLFQNGDIAGGVGLVGASAGAQDRAMLNSVDGQPQSAPVLPPSTNRAASVSVAPPLAKGGERPPVAGGPQGDQAGSIVGIVSAAGIPPEVAGPLQGQLSALTKTDPNATLNPQAAQRVAQAVQAYAQRAKAGQPQATPQEAPAGPVQANPVQVAAQNDPVLKRLTFLAASPDKQVAAAAKVRLESYLKNQELTPDQKNAAASGKSLEVYQNRGDEQATQREVLSKSLLPKLDKSQDTAVAARDDIDSIHRAREELDKDKGIFSGSFADKKLQLAKLASAIGISGADKIANTEAYQAAVGQRVAAMVKAFGSGTAISDGDRRFAQEMAGGRIGLDEQSMRRILEIGERAARGKIANHNSLVDNTIKANDALGPTRDTYTVKAPGEYQKPEMAAGGGTIGSRADYDKLPAGSTFTGPDGKQWRKP